MHISLNKRLPSFTFGDDVTGDVKTVYIYVHKVTCTFDIIILISSTLVIERYTLKHSQSRDGAHDNVYKITNFKCHQEDTGCTTTITEPSTYYL